MKSQLMLLLLLSITAHSAPLATSPAPVSTYRAMRFIERFIGFRPTDPQFKSVVTRVETAIEQSNLPEAVRVTLGDPILRGIFLHITVREWSAHFATKKQTPFSVPNGGLPYKQSDGSQYNAVANLIMGYVRDGVDARQLLTGKDQYDEVGGGEFRFPSGNHAISAAEFLMDHGRFDRKEQDLKSNAVGLFTTGSWAQEAFTAGTNRRAVQMALQTFLCRPIESFMNFGISDNWVRRDVDRHPGGVYKTYRSRCIGCHSGMDALGGAFAKYNVSDFQLYYHPNVVPKMNQNADVFPAGRPVRDDSWENYWVPSSPIKKGKGLREFGEMLAQSDEFPVCMAKTVYEKLCATSSESEEAQKAITQASRVFAENDFQLLTLFETIASRPGCLAAGKRSNP